MNVENITQYSDRAFLNSEPWSLYIILGMPILDNILLKASATVECSLSLSGITSAFLLNTSINVSKYL